MELLSQPLGQLLGGAQLIAREFANRHHRYPRNDAELARFLTKSGGVVLGTQAGDDGTLPAVLIAVDPSTA